MKWWMRGIMVVVLAVVTAAAATVGPALYWRKRGIPPDYLSPSPFEYWDVFEGQTVTWGIGSSRFGMRYIDVYGTGQREQAAVAEKLARSPLPGWADLPRDAAGFEWEGEGYGFPCTALWTSKQHLYLRTNFRDDEMRALLAFEIAGERFTLPTQVYWPGVASNAAFFAVLWALVLLTFSAMRRRRCRRRGLCTECGYDVRGIGLVCPECGASAQGAEKLEGSASSG